MQGSKKLIDSLQAVGIDLIELHLQGKQAHWNLVGHNFRDLHLILDDIIDDARDYSDTCSERIRALHGTPIVATATVAAKTNLPPYPVTLVDTKTAVDLIVQRLDLTAATMRNVYDTVDAEDGASSSLLADWIWKLEKYAWLVGAENMTPNKG